MSESSASQLWRSVAFDHAQSRHDQERHERAVPSVFDEIADLQRKIAFCQTELRREDWQLGSDPDRVRRRYREDLEFFRMELGRVVPVLALAAE